MKVISQIELDKEQIYLEKQKQIISEEREKLIIERSRLYYEWRDLQELDEEYKKVRENLNESNAILIDKMNKRHELNKKTKEDFWAIEIGEQRKKQEKEFDIQLANDRKRFETLTKKLEKEISNKNKKIIKQKESELETQLIEDRKRLDTLRNEIYNDINNSNSIIKKELEGELENYIVYIRKEKETELESQLTEDRKRLDKIRAEIAEEIAVETSILNSYKKSKII
jgi:hypothetical protein